MPKKTRKLRTTSEIERTNHAMFQEAAARQRRCPVCKRKRPFHPHHVVYEQHLKARGLPRFDTRNALRLCVGPLKCHSQHHGGNRKVRTRELTDDNINYAFEALGAYAPDYLRRYYDDSEPDIRIVEREFVEEGAA